MSVPSRGFDDGNPYKPAASTGAPRCFTLAPLACAEPAGWNGARSDGWDAGGRAIDGKGNGGMVRRGRNQAVAAAPQHVLDGTNRAMPAVGRCAGPARRHTHDRSVTCYGRSPLDRPDSLPAHWTWARQRSDQLCTRCTRRRLSVSTTSITSCSFQERTVWNAHQSTRGSSGDLRFVRRATHDWSTMNLAYLFVVFGIVERVEQRLG